MDGHVVPNASGIKFFNDDDKAAMQIDERERKNNLLPFCHNFSM